MNLPRLALPGLLAAAILTGAGATAPVAARPANATDTLLAVTLPGDSLRAMQLQFSGRRDSAIRVVTARRLALAIHPDARVRMRATQIEGVLRANAGDPLAAVPLLTEAIRAAVARRDTATEVRALRWRAYAYGALGRYDDDAADANRMLRLARRSHDEAPQSYALNLLGWVDRKRGRLERARAELLEAVRLDRRRGDEAGEAYALVALGSTEVTLGRYPDAVRSYRRSLELGKRVPFAWAEAQALNDLGVAESAMGDIDLALGDYRRAYDLHVARGQLQEATVNLYNLMQLQSDFGSGDSAATLVRDAIARCERAGLRSQRASMQALLGSIEFARGRHREGIRLLRDVLGRADTLGAEGLSDVTWSLGLMLMRRDSLEAARTVFADYFSRGPATGNARMRLQNRVSYGSCLRELDRRAEAREQFETALRESRTHGFDDVEHRTCVQLALLAEAEGDFAAQLEWLEQAARAWERNLRVRNAARRAPDPTSNLFWLGTNYARYFLLHPPPGTRDGGQAAAFDMLQRFRSRTLLETAAGLRALQASDSTRFAPRPVTLARLQRDVLRPDEVLIEFDYSSGLGILSVVTRRVHRVIEVPGADSARRALAVGLDLLRDPAARADAADGVRLALAREFLGPAAAELRTARHVVLVPGGPLQAAPLEAMAASFAPRGTLVTRVPSASMLALLRGRHVRALRARPMLALAGGSANPDERLEAARREVHALATRYDDVVEARGDDAHAPRTSADLARFGRLHLAGHTRTDALRPWRSSFVVLGGRRRDDDVTLDAEDIARESIPADLVVLSSCSSADTREWSADGLNGLTSAFLAAGARTVVATLWPVDDAATERFMGAFYRHLARGEPAGAALEAAKLEIRSRAESAAPFYWAGYVLAGEDAPVDLREKGFSPGAVRLYIPGRNRHP